jgi:hypothetical protein
MLPVPVIIGLIDAAITLIEKIGPAISALKQNAEMTPEERIQLDERIAKLKDQTHWKV